MRLEAERVKAELEALKLERESVARAEEAERVAEEEARRANEAQDAAEAQRYQENETATACLASAPSQKVPWVFQAFKNEGSKRGVQRASGLPTEYRTHSAPRHAHKRPKRSSPEQRLSCINRTRHLLTAHNHIVKRFRAPPPPPGPRKRSSGAKHPKQR